jgi:transglutaminase-like putative cysteine protease
MEAKKITYTVRIDTAVNTLSYSIGLVSFISIARYVDPFFSISFLGMFALAAFFDYRRRYAISRRYLNAAVVIFILLNSMRISLDNFAEPIVEMLLILLAVKFLEEKKTRDYMQIYTLAVFLLSGSALLSLDIQFLVIVLVLALLLPVGSVLLTFYSQHSAMSLTNRDISRIVHRGLLITLAAVPLAIFIFIILPRTGYPLLNILNRATASAGFNDNVRLGDVSGIQENAAVILRVEMAKLGNETPYWRGIVLDQFDGVSWKNSDGAANSPERPLIGGKRVMQTVYLEPYENRYLFALDRPLSVNYRFAAMRSDLSIISRRNIENRIKYEAVSSLSDAFDDRSADKHRYLQLPRIDYREISKVLKNLADESEHEKTSLEIMMYLKEGGFTYSLTNLPVTQRPIEDFLFKYKYGNCEYFASSMAVMLRLSGIPARLVVGYMGGNYNDFGGYYLVTQNNAHVWVEVYIAGKGWIRMDPTPAAGDIFGRSQKGLFFEVRMLIDAMNYYWNALVIGYDFNKQVTIFAGFSNAIRSPGISPAKLIKILLNLVAIALMIAIVGILVYVAGRRKPADKRLVDDFLKKMKLYGHTRVPGEGLEEFVLRIDDPEIRDKAMRFVSGFQDIYYRDRKINKKDKTLLKDRISDIGSG